MSDDKNIGSIEKLIDAAEACAEASIKWSKNNGVDSIRVAADALVAATSTIEFVRQFANNNDESGRKIYQRLHGMKIHTTESEPKEDTGSYDILA